VDYEALQGVGAMMGSGGFVVLDEADCMVEMTHYFLSFTQRESCGKCTPCRVGTKRMLELLGMLCNGEGKPGDLEQLESLAQVVKQQSLCGLGKTAPESCTLPVCAISVMNLRPMCRGDVPQASARR
jgi:NADH-quinone oxidoreductase subunit F